MENISEKMVQVNSEDYRLAFDFHNYRRRPPSVNASSRQRAFASLTLKRQMSEATGVASRTRSSSLDKQHAYRNFVGHIFTCPSISSPIWMADVCVT
jgi:hypothetical protein